MHGKILYATSFFYALYQMQLRHWLSKYPLSVLIGIKDKSDFKNDCS